MATILSNELRNGTVFQDGDQTFVVLKYSHRKKGRGQATIRVKVRDIESGSITEKTYTSSEKVEAADVARKSAQYLYAEGEDLVFMDSEDFSQFTLPKGQLKKELDFMKEGQKVVVLWLEEKPVSIELPKTVELGIEYTEPAVAGNTATGAMKKAKLETEVEIDVPLFLKKGDNIKVNTVEGIYVNKA